MYVSIEKIELSAHVTSGDTTLAVLPKLYDAYTYAAEHDLTVEPSLKTARRLEAYAVEHPEHKAWVERNLALCPDIPPHAHNAPRYAPDGIYTVTRDTTSEWVVRNADGAECKRTFNLYHIPLSLAKRRVTPVVTDDVFLELVRTRQSIHDLHPARLAEVEAWLETFPQAATLGIPPLEHVPVRPEPDTYGIYQNKQNTRWVVTKNNTRLSTHDSLKDAVYACIEYGAERMDWTTVLDASLHNLLRDIPKPEQGFLRAWHAEMRREWRLAYDPNRTLAGKEARRRHKKTP